MKIEIDLNDILRDEYGDGESLAEGIRRQVVDALVERTKAGVQKRIDEAVSAAISEGLAEAMKEQMPGLIADLMEAEYRPISRYGERGGPTTIRVELLKTIQEQMVYKKASYENDKNPFTRAVDGLVSEQLAAFKAEFTKQVDGKLVAEATQLVASSLAKRFGVLT